MHVELSVHICCSFFFSNLFYIIKTAMATQQCVECSDVSSLDLCTHTVDCAHDEVHREV